MTDDLIGRINEVLDGTTPGPWGRTQQRPGIAILFSIPDDCNVAEVHHDRDADLLVSAPALLREAAEQLAAKDAVLAAAKELCTDKWLSVGNPQTTYADGVADGREQAARDLRRVLSDDAS